MTVTAPPRPPRTPRPSDPIGREEVEALVEALIEEARRRARRRRARNAGVVLSLVVGFALYVGFARGGGEVDSSASSAVPRASGVRDAGTRSLSFRLLSMQTSLRFVDRPPKGSLMKAGDAVYIKDVLRNAWGNQFRRPRNAIVGSDSYSRTALAKPGWELVNMKVRLPGGTLRLRARGPVIGATIVLRVVGGTGRYARARGTNTLQIRGSVPNLNDYELRLP